MFVTADDDHVAEILHEEDGLVIVRRLCHPDFDVAIYRDTDIRPLFGSIACYHAMRDWGLGIPPSMRPGYRPWTLKTFRELEQKEMDGG